MKEVNYESPLVKVVTVAVEQGFAASYEYTNTEPQDLEQYTNTLGEGAAISF